MGKYQASKDYVRAYFDALEKCTADEVVDVLSKYAVEDFAWEGVYPFMYQKGAVAVANTFWKPLKESLKFMQRRQDVFIAGTAMEDGKTWVMSMGQFMGLFDKDYMGIRCTYKMQHMQYFEYNCIEDGKILRSAIFVDILGFMKEANQYPLPPEAGSYFVYPGPRDHNGLCFTDNPDSAQAEKMAEDSLNVVVKMSELSATLYNTRNCSAENLKQTFTDDMIWYGPCGVGASYTIPRYQRQHEIPFRALNDVQGSDLECASYFAEGNFVCFFTHMLMKPDGGWLGMTGGCDKHCLLHADLDIYYMKDGKISENWCFFDIPYFLYEQGLDIFKRTESICNPSDL